MGENLRLKTTEELIEISMEKVAHNVASKKSIGSSENIIC